jgi:hypothetical protein
MPESSCCCAVDLSQRAAMASAAPSDARTQRGLRSSAAGADRGRRSAQCARGRQRGAGRGERAPKKRSRSRRTRPTSSRQVNRSARSPSPPKRNSPTTAERTLRSLDRHARTPRRAGAGLPFPRSRPRSPVRLAPSPSRRMPLRSPASLGSKEAVSLRAPSAGGDGARRDRPLLGLPRPKPAWEGHSRRSVQQRP